MSTHVGTAVGGYSAQQSLWRRVYEHASKLDRVGMTLLRLGLIVVLFWIGGLKFADYEADGIVPLVANSPLMSFFYHYPAPEYRQYMNREGEVIPAHQRWNESNGTYPFSHGLGVLIHPAASFRSGKLPSYLDVPDNALILSDHSGSVGSCIGSFHARIPISVGSGPANHQRRHHVGCRGCHARRLGQDLVVAQSLSVIA